MAMLTVKLLGRFGVWSDDKPSLNLNARRAREVFSYLLLHRDRPHLREKLASLLWEDAPPSEARKYLRQALWQIQTALHCDSKDGDAQPLEADPEWIQLHSCAQLQVDVWRFLDALRCCNGISGPQLDPAQRQLLEGAVDLYRGDLLEGWYHDWCIFERERLLNDLLDTLEKLVTCCVAQRDSERGLAHARRMLTVDPAREQVHGHIMRLHMLAGNRTEALRAYQYCERILMEELGVKPSDQTGALYESIRAGKSERVLLDLDPMLGGPATADGGQFPLHRLRALVEYLAHLQSTFAMIEERLRQELLSAEKRARGREPG